MLKPSPLVVVLGGSFEPDTATWVGSRLRHSGKTVPHSHAHRADGVVGLYLGLAQLVAARGFAHEELLRVERDEAGFVLFAVIAAIDEHRLGTRYFNKPAELRC